MTQKKRTHPPQECEEVKLRIDCQVQKLKHLPTWAEDYHGRVSTTVINSDKRDLNLKKAISSTTHRHRNFLLVNGSSPKHYSGKSCRRIKRREMGSGNDEGDESVYSPENGHATSEELSSHSEQRPEIEISRVVEGLCIPKECALQKIKTKRLLSIHM
ncbi:hypothetical protein QJS10_CPB13g00777 [Acorus calamus]|uniref:Uncharacterized protein n=1 Tax=Acorus calamus TaxID=4465 RepID=A0AAV9DGZ5_ACOCL|nr:hypothetical protein QJS10_CPB13g00777 [Acorus calamus]